MPEKTVPEMEMAQTTPMPATSPEISQGNPLFSKFKNLKLVLGGILGLAVFALAGYWVYANYLMSPMGILKEAAEKMDVDSIKLGLKAEAEGINIDGTVIAHEKGFSKADFVVGVAEEGLQHNFNLNFVADTENVYFQMNYSFMEMLLTQADLAVPGISSTRTFALLKPVITGKSWLHMAVPAEDQAAMDPEEYAKEYEKFAEKVAQALVVKDFQRKKEYQGENYRVISLGVDKAKLLEAIDAMKDLDLEANVADINNLKKSIEDMGELKETLAVVYVDMAGYVRIVDLYAPKGSSESIQTAIEQEAGTTSPIMAQLSQLTTLFQPDKAAKEGESVKFMTLTFDDYGSAIAVTAPTPVVEWDEVLLYAQSELAPIFYQYMMLQQAQPGYGTYPTETYPSAPEVPAYPGQTYPGSAGSAPGSVAPMNLMQVFNK